MAFPEPTDDQLRAALPPGHGRRGRAERALARAADLALDARQRALGIGRVLDARAAEEPAREVLVLGVYRPAGAAAMAAACKRIGRSRHRVRIALGAVSDRADPRLSALTRQTGLGAGKFQNLNRLAGGAAPLAADWVMLLDDDVALPRRFTDRAVCAAEALRLDLAQPALTRASHGVFDVNRRRPALARETPFVEIGPLVLISRRAWKELAPFPEVGMGWGLDLHWAKLAADRGWRCGVLDATPVRHEAQPPAASYARADATAAAVELLRTHEHLRHDQVDRTLATHSDLP